MAILVFGVGQLLLPPLAEHAIRQRLGHDGRVLSVSVSAFPAIELIFGHADTVDVRLATYRAAEAEVTKNLDEAVNVANLNVRIGTVTSGLLTIHSVTMTKRGAQVTGAATVTQAALRAAVPLLDSLTPVGSSGGQLTLRGSADLPVLGRVTADADLGAVDGRVVLSGAGLLGSLIHLTVWSDPHVYVESISGAGAGAGDLVLSVRARMG